MNFTTSAGAKKFKNVVDNFKWGGVIHTPDQTTITSKKICEITWARIQVFLFLFLFSRLCLQISFNIIFIFTYFF